MRATVKRRALPIPADWPRTRVKLGQSWNGRCRECGAAAEAGHLVRWDPHSGKPSKWQHVSCADPYLSGAVTQTERRLF